MTTFKNEGFDLFAFFELTPDLACIAGKDGYFRKINPTVVKTLGYTEEELLKTPINSLIHPDDRELTIATRLEMFEGKALVNFQNRYITKDGSVVWLEWSSVFLADQQVVFALAKNITERKSVQLEVEAKYRKFKSLATHFKASIEEDRKYLASELHEELAQLASVIRMDIEWISQQLPDASPNHKSRMQHVVGMTELFINTIRRLSFTISPHMVDDIGLMATIKWLCREFSLLNGISCAFDSHFDESKLSHEIKIDLFRICQEALMHVMFLAQAGEVSIDIRESGDEIYLTVADDGKNDPENQQSLADGLVGIRERVLSVNGQMNIQSEQGKGTTIIVSIPLGMKPAEVA